MTSSTSLCCFLLNRSNSRQRLLKIQMLLVVWWSCAKITIIYLLLNPVAKYNLTRSSTAGKTHGKRWHLLCDEVFDQSFGLIPNPCKMKQCGFWTTNIITKKTLISIPILPHPNNDTHPSCYVGKQLHVPILEHLFCYTPLLFNTYIAI